MGRSSRKHSYFHCLLKQDKLAENIKSHFFSCMMKTATKITKNLMANCEKYCSCSLLQSVFFFSKIIIPQDGLKLTNH